MSSSADIANPPYPGLDRIRDQITDARSAQQFWNRREVRQRLVFLNPLRGLLVERADDFVAALKYPGRKGADETIPAELLPLADACAFLKREAVRVLSPERLSRRGRPFWLSGVDVEVRREPLGIVLIIGAANYPLLLVGVQVIQALAAGNAVLIKPGQAAGALLKALCRCLIDAGIPESLVQLLPEEPQAAVAAMHVGVDKVVLTGSATTGRSVLSQAAESLTPATMELSGCDAVFVLAGADLDRVSEALTFGLLFNGGGSCIAPRRVFAHRSDQSRLLGKLLAAIAKRMSAKPPYPPIERMDTRRAAELVSAAIDAGAHVETGGLGHDGQSLAAPTVLSKVTADMELFRSDIFAPILSVISVDAMDDALAMDDLCPYRLGATIFGDNLRARDLAAKIDAGCVVINDMLAPTADPRAPFGGRGESGFGVTRGAAGLLEMTQMKTLIMQRKKWLPHLETPTPHDAKLLSGLFAMLHSRGIGRRAQGMRKMIAAIMAQRKWTKNKNAKNSPADH